MRIEPGVRNYGAPPPFLSHQDLQQNARGYGFPGGFVNSVGAGGAAPMELPKQIVRIGEQALWSAFAWTAGNALASQSQRLFVTPEGSNGQGFTPMSIAETNLREASRVPSGFSFAVAGIACQWYVQTTADAVAAVTFSGNDIRQVLANAVLLWDFLQVQIEVAPNYLIGAGGGAFGLTADTGDAEGNRSHVTVGNGQVWIYQNSPVLLPSNTTFAMRVSFGSSAGRFLDAGEGGSDRARVSRVCLLGQFTSAIPTA